MTDYILCVTFFNLSKPKTGICFTGLVRERRTGFGMLYMDAVNNYPCYQGEKNKGILMDKRRENGEKGGTGHQQSRWDNRVIQSSWCISWILTMDWIAAIRCGASTSEWLSFLIFFLFDKQWEGGSVLTWVSQRAWGRERERNEASWRTYVCANTCLNICWHTCKKGRLETIPV